MSKEIYISSTPQETRLAIVEKDELTEIYYERENEYTLAGSIYNGKVTRVLPGMQSSFVDIGLERDAFLYITDFMEEAGDSADFDGEGGASRPREPRTIEGETGGGEARRESSGEGSGEVRSERSGRGDRGGRDRGGRDRGGRGRRDRGDRGPRTPREGSPVVEETRANVPVASESFVEESEGFRDEAESFVAETPRELDADEVGEGAPGADGSRRWRGRRGRRRGGRAGEPRLGGAVPEGLNPEGSNTESFAPETGATDTDPEFEEPLAEAVQSAPVRDSEQQPRAEGGRGDRGGRERGGRDRGRGRGGRDRGGREERPRQADVDLSAAAEAGAGESSKAEPFILPGESLGKYRKGEPGAADAAAKPVAEVLTPKASTEFVVAGWDGGTVLPGETLRPRGGAGGGESAAPRQDRGGQDRGGRDRDRGGRDRAGRDRGSRDRGGRDRGGREQGGREQGGRERFESRKLEPGEAVLPAVTSQHEIEPTQGYSEQVHVPVHETQEFEERISAQAEAAHAEVLELHEETQEYEPGEDASASFRVDPAGTREFRQASPVEEVAAGEPEFTSVQATGEMISEPPVAEASVPEATHEPLAPVEQEGAVQDVTADVDEAPLSFAPGEGELEEELLDEEDGEIGAVHAGAFDEEMEEETLEAAADLGSMIEDMSIDRISQHETEEDDEEFSDEEMEEDELGTDEELAGSEADEEGFAEEDAAARGFEESFDEHGEPKPVVESAARTERPRREGGRDRGRGGRDRGGRGGSDRGGSDRSGNDRSGSDRSGGERSGSGDRSGGRDKRGMAGSRGGGRGGRHSVQTQDLPAISDLLKPGQEVLVQIAKEPIAKKGARITSHIALPGRFLVFMPTVSHVGVSRKIESDGERRRLKEILLSEKGEASGGFIVRTAASGASEEELRSDLRFLLNLWADIKTRSESSKSPALIYHDLNLIERILRDQVTDNFSAIWVDTEAEYERVLRFLQRFQPSLIRRVKLYSKETPLFEQFGITAEINKALAAKVWLKSGGSIVINQTEALVAIDINTGKFVGKTARLEDTIVKTNLDSIPEIVRQIRLRDLGGIIIIDFIDMDDRKNRNKVLATLEEELKKDRAPSKVLQFNDFGLVAITRKRVKQSLERTLSTTCGICAGTGMVKAPITVCNEIYIELRKMHKHLDKGDIMLRVNPEVVKQLKLNSGKWLSDMEEMSGKTILVKSDPSLHPEQFDLH